MTADKHQPRLREALGITIGPLLKPGPLNAITDVPRVRVGMAQAQIDIEDHKSPTYAQAGVTAIGTRDMRANAPFAGIHTLQGAGEMTGAHFIEESRLLVTPIMITGTQNVGHVYAGVTKFTMEADKAPLFALPCVAETYDRVSHPTATPINDKHVHAAIQSMLESPEYAPVPEGNVGGGTPMCSFGLKGGSGTSSHVVPNVKGGNYTVGVFVQANHGTSVDLSIDGVNVGRTLFEEGYTKPRFPDGSPNVLRSKGGDGDGSIIAVVATDAPLLPHQCKALARRAGVGVSRGGGGVGVYSGDIFIAFSTALPLSRGSPPVYKEMIEPVSTYAVETVTNDTLDALFRATADATEEAILNALLAAEQMQTYDGRVWRSFPIKRVAALLGEAGR